MKKKYTQEQVDKLIENAKSDEKLRCRQAYDTEQKLLKQFETREPKYVVGTSVQGLFGQDNLGNSKFFYTAKQASAWAISNHGTVYILGPRLDADATLAIKD